VTPDTATPEQRLDELEEISRRLEPGPEERERLLRAVTGRAERFLEELRAAPAFRHDPQASSELRDHPFAEAPGDVDDLMDLFRRAVEEPGLKPASAGHMAYIPGGGLFAAALGDYLAAVTNEYAGIRFTGPGAVEVEDLLVDWMAGLVGFPETAAGTLTSGGSLANLVALVTAREARGIRAADVPRAVVYLTDQTHHCVDKALRVAGMGECVRRRVETDRRHRMDPSALARAVEQDRAEGLLPWTVVASAGSTDVGAVDPLRDVARVARDADLWYHVDAAYGGFFILCPGVRGIFDGIEEADSVVMDPHKGLFLPYGLGAAVVKDRDALYEAHRHTAAYMQDADEERPPVDSPADLSPELSRHFRGLRLWLPLMLHGLQPFRAGLQEKLLLARRFHRRVERLGFEAGPEPELSVSTYRWVPDEGDPDAFNRRLVDAIHRDGRVFVSSTRLDGHVWLRLAVLCFRTHRETVDLLLEVLEEKVRELEGDGVRGEAAP
jgi:glutamate/tyrosine decarboxylase-like PLP-dependent enzyme